MNARAKDYTETRVNFTMQWLNEDGATPFLRAAHSGDTALMKLLLAHGADPKIATEDGTTALMAAAEVKLVVCNVCAGDAICNDGKAVCAIAARHSQDLLA